jgi:ABC-2 type transport system permease protein
MRVAIVIAAKELRQRLRDRSAIFIAFVAPTLLAAIVTGAFGSGFGPNASDIHFSATIADADHSPISQAFAGVLRSPQLRKLVTPLRDASEDEARAAIDSRSTDVAFVIPRGFQAAVTSGQKASLTVIGRADLSIYQDIAQAIATSFTQQVSADRLAVFTTLRSGAKVSNIAALAAEAAARQMPVQVKDAGLATRPVSGANYFGPGMAMFFLFFTVGAGARSLFAEREQGTLQRLLAAPTGRGSIIAGKAGAVFVLGVCSMTSVYVAMRFLFGVSWGDPLAVLLLTVLAVAAVMSIAAVVQTLAKTEQQAAAYGSIVGMVFALAGGNFFPLFQMPALVQKISALTPNGWALRGFTDIAYDGARAANLLPNFAAIASFAIVCGTIAWFNARRIAVR